MVGDEAAKWWRCGGCTVGWVNLYQKFEIEKYTVCGKLILPKKWKGIFNNFFLAQNKF